MSKLDIRTLQPEDQLIRRKRVILLHGRGLSNCEISKIAGYCYTHVSTIIQKFKKGYLDDNSTEPKKRGRKLGTQRKLTCDQEAKVKEFLIETSPAKLKYDTGLWSRETIRMVIEQEFGIVVPLRTITDYLKRWGILPKKPSAKAGKQNIRAFKHWLKAEYPDIKARSEKEKAIVYWFDYADIESNHEKDWNWNSSESMSMPESYDASKHSVKILSAITNRGEKCFKPFRGKLTPPIFRSFLYCLSYKKSRNIFLILRHHKVHMSILVNNFLDQKKTPKIEFFYLP